MGLAALSMKTIYLALALVATSLGPACSKKSEQRNEARGVSESAGTVETTEANKPVAYYRDSKIKIPDCSDVARQLYSVAKTAMPDVTEEQISAKCSDKFSSPYKICLLDSAAPDMRLLEHCLALDCELAFTRLEVLAMDADINDESLEGKRSDFVAVCEELPQGTTKCLDEASNLEVYKSCDSTNGLASVVGSQDLGWDKPAIPGVDTWLVSNTEDRMDGSVTVVARREAKDKIETGFAAVHPSILMRCDDGKFELYLNVHQQIRREVGSDYITTRIKLDDEKAFEHKGSRSTSGDALFMVRPYELARRFVGHKTLLVEFTPYSSTRTVVEFGIDRANDALTQLSACKSN